MISAERIEDALGRSDYDGGAMETVSADVRELQRIVALLLEANQQLLERCALSCPSRGCWGDLGTCDCPCDKENTT